MRKSRHIKSLLLVPIVAIVVLSLQILLPSSSVAVIPASLTSHTTPVSTTTTTTNPLSRYESHTYTIYDPGPPGKFQYPIRTVVVPAKQKVVYPPPPPTTTTTTTIAPKASYSPPETTNTAPVVSGGGGWAAVAKCEEGGSNNYTYGYFGILPQSWGNYAGVSTAGQASWDVQVARGDQINGGGPPWAPWNCALGGYTGW